MAITYEGGSFGENLVETGNVVPSLQEASEAYDAAMQPVYSQQDENRQTEVNIAGEQWDKLQHFSKSLENFVTPRVDKWIAEADDRATRAQQDYDKESGEQTADDHQASLEENAGSEDKAFQKKLKQNAKSYEINRAKTDAKGKPFNPQENVADLTRQENRNVVAGKDAGIIQEKVLKQTGGNIFASRQFKTLDPWARDALQIQRIQQSLVGYNPDEIKGIMGYTNEGRYNAAMNNYRSSKLKPIMQEYEAANLKPSKAFLQKYFYDPTAIIEQKHKQKWMSTAKANIIASEQTTEKQQWQTRVLNASAKDPNNDLKKTKELTESATVREIVNRVTYLAGTQHFGDTGAAWTHVFEDLNELIKAGAVNRDFMQALENGKYKGTDGKLHTIPEQHSVNHRKLKESYNAYVKHDNQVASANKKKGIRDFHQYVVENMPKDENERKAYLDENQRMYTDSLELGAGQESKFIKHLIDAQTPTGNLVKEYTDRANYLAEIDLLTVKYLMRPEVPVSVRQDFMEEAKRQDERRALDPYNEDKFTKMAADDVMPDNKQDSSIGQVGEILHKRYKEIAKDLHINNVPNAYQEAYDRVDEWWKENNINYKTLHGYDYKKLRGDANRTSGMFRRKGIVNLTKLEKETTNRLTAKLHDLGGKVLTTKVETRGDGLIDTAVASFEEIEDMSKGFGKPEFTIDPKLYWLSNHLRDEDGHKIHPITALNQLRETVGLPSLGTTDSEILFNTLNPVAQYDVMNNSQNSQDVKARVYWGSDVNGRLVSSEKKLKEGSPELVKFKESLLSEDVSKKVNNIVQENDLPKDSTFPAIYRMMVEGVDVTGIEIPFSDSWRELQLYKLEMTEDPKEYESTLQQLIDPALLQNIK